MRKRKKKKIRGNVINSTSMLMIVCSILVSYGIVFFNSSHTSYIRESKFDNLARSADRIAMAFEEYNLKRFAF